MSEQNIERARRGIEALGETYRTGDMRAWRRQVEEVADPEIALETDGGAFTEGEWRGKEGAVRFVANQMEVLEGMWVEADEILDVGEDRVLVLITFGGRARHTGLPVTMSPAHLFDYREGKVVRWRVFSTHRQARRAVGLPT